VVVLVLSRQDDERSGSIRMHSRIGIIILLKEWMCRGRRIFGIKTLFAILSSQIDWL
jgi:hypothetical protein